MQLVMTRPKAAAPLSLYNLGRALFGLLFLGGGISHLVVSLPHPELLDQYAQLALLPLYRDLILSLLKPNAQMFAALLFAFELVVGHLIVAKGPAVKVGMLAGIIFMIAIIPAVGWYSLLNVFTAPLLAWLMRKDYSLTVIEAGLSLLPR